MCTVTAPFELEILQKLDKLNSLQCSELTVFELTVFELTVFKLTVHFKHEMIGIWQRFHRNFELSGTSN